VGNQELDLDMNFYQLVLSLQAAAWQQMGKVSSPLTGKMERNLEQAKASIDLLEMLQRKTEGNLSSEEKKLLDHVLYELRMNYVDEAKKPATEPEEAKDESEKQPESPARPAAGEETTTTGTDEQTAADDSQSPRQEES